MATIFGPSPVDVQAAIRSENIDQQNRTARSFVPGLSLGLATGGAFANAFNNALGVADPRLRQATARERLKRDFIASGLPFGSQEAQDFIVTRALKDGLLDVAQQTTTQFTAMRKAASDAAKAQSQATIAGREAIEAVDRTTPEGREAARQQRLAASEKAVTDAQIAKANLEQIGPTARARRADQARARAAELRAIEKHEQAIEDARLGNAEQLAARVAQNPVVDAALRAEQGLSIAEPAFRQLKTAPEEARPSLDLQLVIALYKSVDPGSTVSGPEVEGQARGSNFDGVKQAFRLLDAGGGRLTNVQRRELLKQIRGIADETRKQIPGIRRAFTVSARKNRLDVDVGLEPIRVVEQLMRANRQGLTGLAAPPTPRETFQGVEESVQGGTRQLLGTAGGILSGVGRATGEIPNFDAGFELLERAGILRNPR